MTAQSSNPRTDLRALLIGVSDYPSMPDKALPGARGDVILWRELLQTMGVADHHIWSAAEVPQTNLAGIESILAQLGAELEDDAANRLLVVWGGHGQQCASGELALATSDTAPTADGFASTLSYTRLMDILDSRPAAVELTLILDTCFAGAGPDHRALTEGGGPVNWPSRRRPTDLVVSASTSGQKSFDLTVHGQTAGALSWAATAVLERWGVSRTPGQVDLTLTELRDRVEGLLTAMAVDQTPHVDGPETGFRFLHSGHTQVGSGAPQALPGQEIDPGTTGGMVFDLVDTGGTVIGHLVATHPTNSQVVSYLLPNRIYFGSIGPESMPTVTLKNARELKASTAIAQSDIKDQFKASAFKKKSFYSVSGRAWKVTALTGTHTGVLLLKGDELMFAMDSDTPIGANGVEYLFEYDSSLQLHGHFHRAVDVRVS